MLTAEEFDAFYEGCFDRLVVTLRALTGHGALAEDSVQQAFVRAWAHRATLDASGSPEAWVRATAYRLATRRRPAAWLGRRRPAPTDHPDDHSEVRVRLGHLPPTQRQALVLHDLCGLSLSEIAREVGVPVGTVKARLARAHATMGLLAETGGTHV